MATLRVQVRLGKVSYGRKGIVSTEGSITNRCYQATVKLVAAFCKLYPWLQPVEGQTLISLATNVGDREYWLNRAASHLIRAAERSAELPNPRRSGSLTFQSIRRTDICWNNQRAETQRVAICLRAASKYVDSAPALDMQIIDDLLTVTIHIPDDVEWGEGPPQRTVLENFFGVLQIARRIADAPPYGTFAGSISIHNSSRGPVTALVEVS